MGDVEQMGDRASGVAAVTSRSDHIQRAGSKRMERDGSVPVQFSTTLEKCCNIYYQRAWLFQPLEQLTTTSYEMGPRACVALPL